ncbi:MAG: ATP-binding protein [Clostridia bacterium]|nr:ATP-binding protein [Clostridia bacterium]
MGNIVLLDDLTINKIAAGEVIERPASVVKELVENSIDAGATNISIETRNGGISYIRITDNGKGFMPDDMEIAFERHATSKIRKAEDLETVKSMGFRGEALASIAAIARVELTSKTEDASIGYKIIVEGGKIISKEEIGCPKGTTITVENLFFNTPVRYKFLKKDFTEAGYIEDAVTRIALVNPNIAIKLISSGKTIIRN